MKESTIISSVIDILSEPKSWIKNIRAQTGDGSHTVPTDPEAVQFCLGGAVMRVLGINGECKDWEGWYGRDPVGNRFHNLAKSKGYANYWQLPFVMFNNDPSTTHEDMMLFLKEALYDAELEERD